jgi:hypothetical protein
MHLNIVSPIPMELNSMIRSLLITQQFLKFLPITAVSGHAVLVESYEETITQVYKTKLFKAVLVSITDFDN